MNQPIGLLLPILLGSQLYCTVNQITVGKSRASFGTNDIFGLITTLGIVDLMSPFLAYEILGLSPSVLSLSYADR